MGRDRPRCAGIRRPAGPGSPSTRGRPVFESGQRGAKRGCRSDRRLALPGGSRRARLALMQTEDGRWRVEFDEPWAREGAKPPESEPAEEGAAAASATSRAA